MEIIMTKKFKDHMKVHSGAFVTDYKDIVRKCQQKGVFNCLHSQFEELTVTFDYPVGYADMFETQEKDNVIYAIRKGRNIYSRFVTDKEPYLINTCAILLNQSYVSKTTYSIVTMFPGYVSQKAPQDKNIKTSEELKDSISFWKNHAILFNPDDVLLDTVTTACPYEDLLIKNCLMC